MTRFIHLIRPVFYPPTFGRFPYTKPLALLSGHLLSWLLVLLSFYYSVLSGSTMLLGVATLQVGMSLLVLLESFLHKYKVKPLQMRRLEMTAYCVGGLILLFLCIYQFNEAYLSLKSLKAIKSWEVNRAIGSSIFGNLMLIRLLWLSGLIKTKIRIICRPLLGILTANLISLLSCIFIFFIKDLPLDAWLSLISSVFLFLLTGAMMVDAYWHLKDLEMMDFKKPETSILSETQ